MKELRAAFLAILFITSICAEAREPNKKSLTNVQAHAPAATGCQPTTAQVDLDINNVRAKLLAGGDMWWDLTNASYEIPKGSGLYSMFSGALWIGGLDPGGQLKIAAHTYRQQSSYDFWTGPINQVTGDVTAATCLKYDRHWKLNKKDVREFIDKNGSAGYIVPEAIMTWPGNGDAANNEAMFLAPFFDADGDGIYDYTKGDYPKFDFTGTAPCKSCGSPNYEDNLHGDQAIWWVFNDVGNVHTETGSPSMGLEVQAQAFAFKTGDEINNMTFYKYKLINRSSAQLNEMFFGQWCDVDMGNYADDFIGCDVSRGLGYAYNGDADDEGPQGYGLNPPAIGIDFFQGPLADAGDGVDNNHNGIIDEQCEEIIMSKFCWDGSDFSVTGNPEIGIHFYYKLKGAFKDGTSWTYGGYGYNPTGGVPCDYMYPGDSDPTGIGTNGIIMPPWYDQPPASDRRWMQSVGPFTLPAGGVNYVTTGVIWARASNGGPLASVELLKIASDKGQALFDYCFQLISGPKAPDVAIRELDKKLILSLQNTKDIETYNEIDPLISTVYPTESRKYKFQGYQIFQLKDGNVSLDDVYARNADNARLLAQVDLVDGVTQIVNFEYDVNINSFVPMEMVKGENKGIKHTFVIDKDLFALGNNALVNYKTYHYTVLSYAHNSYKKYDPIDPNALDGQRSPYLASTQNVEKYSAVPHKVYGVNVNGVYGDGPAITRIEGTGNGGGVLDLAPGVEELILNSPDHAFANPTYKGNSSTKEEVQGPVNVRIFDPVKVKDASYELRLNGIGLQSKWTLYNLATGQSEQSAFDISTDFEYLFPTFGLNVKVTYVTEPGDALSVNNGFLEGTLSFADNKKAWLSGVADRDGLVWENWIRSGTEPASPPDYVGADDEQVYEKVIGGTWAPYRLCSKDMEGGPKFAQSADALGPLSRITSVDVVFTADKSKWTRSCIVEMDHTGLGVGGASKFDLRKSPSVDKNGNNDGTGMGMGWFPGYAINLETGERMNIIFGENSFMQGDNGADMLWNPTSATVANNTPIFGGQHYMYVMATRYDACVAYNGLLSSGSVTNKRNTFKDALWVSIPLLKANQTLLASTARVRLRVAKPYATYQTSVTPVNNNVPVYRFSTTTIKSEASDVPALKSILDRIKVVPNPYFAFSDYETNQYENTVKIINLPPQCQVSIYTVNGTLIRRFERGVPGVQELLSDGPDGIPNMVNNIDWDLKNSAQVPIGSGIYLIHVKLDGVGERVIKWFATMRKFDNESP